MATPKKRPCYYDGCDRPAIRRVELVERGTRPVREGEVVLVWVCNKHRTLALRNLKAGLPTFSYKAGPEVWTPERLQQVYDLHDQGWSLREIAAEVGTSFKTIHRKLKERK